MNKEVVCLYPDFGSLEPLQGLYLRRKCFAEVNADRPFVYANFLSSLDGRIAWREFGEQHYQLPESLKSDEDFRLFLELYAHADCIITHGGYMRALSAGRLGNVLQIPKLAWTEDIHAWREAQGLPPAPDVVILSGSLEFPWHESLDMSGQKVHIITGAKHKSSLKENWSKQGHDIKTFGTELNVDVEMLMKFLRKHGYRSVYLVAGPQLLQDLLLHRYIDRFFITMCHQLLGGEDFKSIIPNNILGDKGRMILRSLYMDQENSSMFGQWYAEFSHGM